MGVIFSIVLIAGLILAVLLAVASYVEKQRLHSDKDDWDAYL